MNIFVLDPDPVIAASYHCDQHIHKMILESAQMLSTVARDYLPYLPDYTGYYKPTHHNHPCTQWLRESKTNCAWLIQLCRALDSIRLDQGAQDTHASMAVVELFASDALYHFDYKQPADFVFAGRMDIASRTDLDVVGKYREYYRVKSAYWAVVGNGPMTWKGRTRPEWMD
jgi:Pyrimidine dimer DNA glycosylase